MPFASSIQMLPAYSRAWADRRENTLAVRLQCPPSLPEGCQAFPLDPTPGPQ